MTVVIDGAPHSMGTTDTDFAAGAVYTSSSPHTFAVGTHNYYFEATGRRPIPFASDRQPAIHSQPPVGQRRQLDVGHLQHADERYLGRPPGCHRTGQ